MQRKPGIVAGAVLALAAMMSAALGAAPPVEERIVWPGEHMNLEGTKKGPHYIYMTKEERAHYVRRMTVDPEGKKEFADTKSRADATVAGEADDRESLVLTYLVTRGAKYFDAWRLRWLAESNRLNTLYRTPMDMAKAYGPSNHFIWGKPGWAWDYDLMAGELSDKEEELFRWQLKKYCDALRIWKVDRKNVKGQGEGTNMAALTIGRTSPQWFAIGYDQCIEWSISHKPAGGRDGAGGLLEWMRPMRDHRVWGEAPIYQWYVGWGLSELIERAWRYDGRDVWNLTAPNGTKPRNVVDGVIDMAFPLERTGFGLGSIRIANFGEDATSLWRDQWLNLGGGGRATWQGIVRSVYRASRDKGYGWLASVNRGVGDPAQSLPIDPNEVAPPPAPCSVLPSIGVAMLRADESPNYWLGRGLAMQVMGGERRRSAPGDSFSIRLHGAGRLLYPDWPMVTYEVYTEGGWERAGVRRNSAMIDGRETSTHRTIWRHAFWPEVKYLSLRGSRYGHDRSERAFMMTKEYLLDVFDMVVGDGLSPDLHYYPRAGMRKQYARWSRAGLWNENGKLPDSHTFDYILHGIGQQALPDASRFVPSREFVVENWPNRCFRNERRREMGGAPFHVDWIQRSGGMEERRGIYKNLGKEWFVDRAAVRMHMLGSPGTVVYALEAPMGAAPGAISDPLPRLNVVNPDEHPEMTLKTLIVRRRGKAAQFVALHEPYRDRPAITRLEYLHRPAADDAVRTVGVKVAGPDYVDRLYVTLGQPGYTQEDGVQEARVAPEEAVEVSVERDYLPGDVVRFSGQLYMRQKGEVLTVRGDVKSFCIYAPDLEKLVLNGEPAELRRVGNFALYGQAKEPANPSYTLAAPERYPPLPRLQVSLPQGYVNLDAQEGGRLVVRLANWGPVSGSGNISVECVKGLTVSEPQRFDELAPEHRQDLIFSLTPKDIESGTVVPITVRMEVDKPLKLAKFTKTIPVQVAVGVVLEEVPATYVIPLYNYEEGQPGRPKPKSEWLTRKFDYIQVRAPGYTLRVDKFSGGTRWLMDPTGVVRTTLAGYPAGMTRDKHGRFRGKETLNGPWLEEAKYLGISRDDEGNPVLAFSSLDGKNTWKYVLTASRAGKARYGTIDVPGPAEPSGLGFEIPKEPWWQEKPVSIWPTYPLEPPVEKPQEQGKNLLAGLKPRLELPPEVAATGGVYLDEKHTVNGTPSICFDLDKLRGLGSRKYRMKWHWPLRLMLGNRYRFAFKMRHQNVANLLDGEPISVNCLPVGNWVSKQAGEAKYWPRPVRDWFRVHDRVVIARGGVPSGSYPVFGSIKVPGDPDQTGKIWLGGFLVEEAD